MTYRIHNSPVQGDLCGVRSPQQQHLHPTRVSGHPNPLPTRQRGVPVPVEGRGPGQGCAYFVEDKAVAYQAGVVVRVWHDDPVTANRRHCDLDTCAGRPAPAVSGLDSEHVYESLRVTQFARHGDRAARAYGELLVFVPRRDDVAHRVVLVRVRGRDGAHCGARRGVLGDGEGVGVRVELGGLVAGRGLHRLDSRLLAPHLAIGLPVAVGPHPELVLRPAGRAARRGVGGRRRRRLRQRRPHRVGGIGAPLGLVLDRSGHGVPRQGEYAVRQAHRQPCGHWRRVLRHVRHSDGHRRRVRASPLVTGLHRQPVLVRGLVVEGRVHGDLSRAAVDHELSVPVARRDRVRHRVAR